MPSGVYIRTKKISEEAKKKISNSLKGIKRSKETKEKMSKPLKYVITKKGCWVVTSHKPNGRGYVHIQRDGKTIRAHRYSYEKCIGVIPEGMLICHTCDNPLCINPNHLFIGTHADNMLDMAQKGRASRGEDRKLTKLKEEDIIEIRNLLRRNVSCYKIASMFNTTAATISRINTGKTWKWVA